MNQELEQKLYDAYPAIFRQKDLDMTKTCMCWGICCDDGWYDLIDRLCAKIQTISKASNIVVEAGQVKEKFAGLRFYTDSNVVREANDPLGTKYQTPEATATLRIWHNIIEDVITIAENESLRTCEMCGSSGKQHHKGGWFKTLCKECAEKNNYKPSAKP